MKIMLTLRTFVSLSELLPEWRRLLADRGSPFSLSCAGSPYAEFNPDGRSVLVLEDMRPRGYSVVEDRSRLTENHLKVALEELARFHALGYAYLNSNPGRWVLKQQQSE